MFQFPGFALSHESTGSSIQWVAPFGNARIKTCLQFPEPFRSLPRPSSPPDSLGIRRSLFVPFSLVCFSTFRRLRTVNHESFDSFLLLPIEIVVRKFPFDNFFYQTNSIFCFTSNLFSQSCQ